MWKLILLTSLNLPPHVPIQFDELQECVAIRSAFLEVFPQLKAEMVCARDA